MEKKYNNGQTVFERTRPRNKLIISRYNDGLYYCKAMEDFKRKELVYFERELNSQQVQQ